MWDYIKVKRTNAILLYKRAEIICTFINKNAILIGINIYFLEKKHRYK